MLLFFASLPSPYRKLLLNRGAAASPAGLPSQALRASSPKVGALGKGVKSERSAFGSPCDSRA